MNENLHALVIEKTLRVPAPAGPAGDGAAAARQFDVVLMSAGFMVQARGHGIASSSLSGPGVLPLRGEAPGKFSCPAFLSSY